MLLGNTVDHKIRNKQVLVGKRERLFLYVKRTYKNSQQYRLKDKYRNERIEKKRINFIRSFRAQKLRSWILRKLGHHTIPPGLGKPIKDRFQQTTVPVRRHNSPCETYSIRRRPYHPQPTLSNFDVAVSEDPPFHRLLHPTPTNITHRNK